MLQLVKKERGGKGSVMGRSIHDEPDPPSTSESWCVKYAPSTVKELAMYHTKIKAIRDWLRPIVEPSEESPLPAHPVLVLCGNSGCGKSTALELLCKEMGVGVKVWTDDCWETDTGEYLGNTGHSSGANRPVPSSSTHVPRYSDWTSSDRPSNLSNQKSHEFLFATRQKSKESQFTVFAVSSAYPSLALTTTSAPSSRQSGGGTKGRIGKSSAKYRLTAVLESDHDMSKDADALLQPHIALIHDPPILFSSSPKGKGDGGSGAVVDNELLGRIILSFDIPVVIILSDLAGREEVGYSVDKCIASAYRQWMTVTSLYCNPVTPRAVSKVLERIATQEGCSDSSMELSCPSHTQTLSKGKSRGRQRDEWGDTEWDNESDVDSRIGTNRYSERKGVQGIIEALAETCRGDLRHAIVQFEFLSQAFKYRQQQQALQRSLLRSQRHENTINIPKSRPEPAPKRGRRGQPPVLIDLVDTSDEDTVPQGVNESESGSESGEEEWSDSQSLGHGYRRTTTTTRSTQNNSSTRTSARTKARGKVTVHKQTKATTTGKKPTSAARQVIDSDTDSGTEHLKSNSKVIATYVNRHKTNSGVTADLTTVTLLPTYSLSSGSHPSGMSSQVSEETSEQDVTDEKYSFLHAVAKLANACLDNNGRGSIARPDKVFDNTDMDGGLLVDFLQFNSVPLMVNSQRLESLAGTLAPLTHTSASTDSWQDVGTGVETAMDATPALLPMRDEMDQLEAILRGFSDVTLMAHRRYDTSHQLDRSQNVFPDEYVSHLSSRICMCARAAGAKERLDWAKYCGVKTVFQGIYKPKTTALRYNQLAVDGGVRSLRDLMAVLPLRSDPTRAPDEVMSEHRSTHLSGLLHGSVDLVVEIVPYLKLFQSLAHSNNAIRTDQGNRGTTRFGAVPLFRKPTHLVQQCLAALQTGHQQHAISKTHNGHKSQHARANNSTVEEQNLPVDLVAEIGEDIDSFED